MYKLGLFIKRIELELVMNNSNHLQLYLHTSDPSQAISPPLTNSPPREEFKSDLHYHCGQLPLTGIDGSGTER